jgi:hypothetical protein
MNDLIINEELALKVKEVVSHGLCSGLGKPEPGKMCVEAAVNYACGFEHGDEPSCVGAAVRRYKIQLNDANWSNDQARAEGMKRIAVAQLGSDQIDQVEFSKRVALKVINKLLPVLFREKWLNLPTHADACEKADGLAAASYASDAASDASYAASYASYAASYASDAASDASYASDAASYASYAASYAARAASYASDAASYASDASDAASDTDKYLILSAEICLEVLKEMKSPGCEFLYLFENTTV